MSRRTLASPLAQKIRLAAAVAASAALVGWASEAAACDCVPLEGLQPSSTSKKVPTNTKVWLSRFGCDTPILQRSDGTPVSATLTKIDGTRVLHPDAPLEMGTTYEVLDCSEAPVTTFTINEGPDNEPPPRPAVSPLDAESGSGDFSSCGSYEYVPLLADQTDVILMLDIAGRATLDPEAASGEVSDVFFPNHKPLVGNAVCSGSNWDFDDNGPAVDARLGAFDYAGNFSGWSDPQTVGGAGCGCEAAGADRAHGYGILALGVLGLAALRARRIKK
jgi:MYXO-CTERM domain-containing protein